VQVLEPPQLSAIGNPKNAALDPLGPNRIYVRAAQVRTLLSIDLPALDAIVALVNAVTDLAGPLTNTLNALLNLNLVAVLNSLTCALGVPCQTPDIIVLPGPIRLDVALEVASASSYVTAYSCVSNTNKTLTTNTSTSLVNLKIGRIDAASMFGSNTTPPAVTVQPLKVIDIGIKTCRRLLFLPITCDPRVPGVGGGIDIRCRHQRGGERQHFPRVLRTTGQQPAGNQSATVLLRVHHQQHRQQSAQYAA